MGRPLLTLRTMSTGREAPPRTADPRLARARPESGHLRAVQVNAIATGNGRARSAQSGSRCLRKRDRRTERVLSHPTFGGCIAKRKTATHWSRRVWEESNDRWNLPSRHIYV